MHDVSRSRDPEATFQSVSSHDDRRRFWTFEPLNDLLIRIESIIALSVPDSQTYLVVQQALEESDLFKAIR
jgi:hypothetical protein